jgi:hypothetical protein
MGFGKIRFAVGPLALICAAMVAHTNGAAKVPSFNV